MEGKHSPRSRAAQIRLTKERERRRLRRRGRNYDPLRVWMLTESEEQKPNPYFKIRGKPKGQLQIDVPSSLACDTPADWELLCSLLVKVREASLERAYKKILLNFHDVVAMSPEAAVTIVAEIQRCNAFCKGRTEITGTYPAAHDVAWLLDDVGFFKALDIKSPPFPKKYQPRSFLQIERNHRSEAEVADRLLDCFSRVFQFEKTDRKRLHVALLECMDNVFEHAYAVESADPYLFREWWLAGYADAKDGTIGFAFYDQGSGIPATIRSKKRRTMKERFENVRRWSDAKWIERAVRKGVSRHSSARRGHGLVKLKRFVDKLGVVGSLRVVANKGIATFHSDKTTDGSTLKEALNGTLVVWQLSGVAVVVPEANENEHA
ncbi:ATP-binding protein [uncultured Stenotrophomonas sp.]|uniref:ATP-binding protein n=1 Tax=uncultured Stenotrophomonas sp. TaxID=165438 RepID=UPI00258D0E3E|nr:ATP-binding protein [uncultured Stenotrophomonas sp.]